MRYRRRSIVKVMRLLKFGCIELQMARNERRRRRVMRWGRQCHSIDSNALWGLCCAFGVKDYGDMARRIDAIINWSANQRRYHKAPSPVPQIRVLWEAETYKD